MHYWQTIWESFLMCLFYGNIGIGIAFIRKRKYSIADHIGALLGSAIMSTFIGIAISLPVYIVLGLIVGIDRWHMLIGLSIVIIGVFMSYGLAKDGLVDSSAKTYKKISSYFPK